MSTIEDRVKKFVGKLPLSCANYRKEIEGEVLLLLKREQKITRHACAESAEYVCLSSRECGRIITNEVHAAVMNTQIP